VKPRQVPSALAALLKVTAPDGTVYASDGLLFTDGQFGRDSIQAGLDLATLRPAIARAIILASARLQGVRDAPPGPDSNEEERGRMYHEHRQRVMPGREVSSNSIAILDYLSKRWGGNGDELTYYGSVDATPMYIKLVAAEAVASDGTVDGSANILNHTYIGRDGLPHTVADSVAQSALWMERRILGSQLGLLDFCRSNPDGIEYQVWTDGKTSLLEPSGPNGQGVTLDPTRPIATPEVQAVAYDALREAARLLGTTRPDDARRWHALANTLQRRTLDAFWMADRRYMAMAVTTDANSKPRQIATMATLGAEMLNTGFFDNLPEVQKRLYVDGIVSTVAGPNFVTDAGVRVISREHAAMVPYWQYQGVHTSWPKQTFAVVQGLHHHSFHRLARALEVRLLNTVNISGEMAEFFYVTRSGGAVYDPANLRGLPGAHVIAGTNVPEPGQTWTGSAVHVIKTWWKKRWQEPPAQTAALESRLLRDIPDILQILDTGHIARLRANRAAFKVNEPLGRRRETAILERSRRHHRAARMASPDQGIA
jgi:glycogen debranching enzyme